MLLALLPALAAPLQVDLDGDGTKETIRYDGASQTVFIGKHKVECDGDPCELAAHDVSSADKRREVSVCSHGVRDYIDCDLYTLEKGKLVAYTFAESTYPPAISTSGNGLVLVTHSWAQRLYERVEKYRASGTRLTEVKQPIYSAPKPVPMTVDRTFPLLYAPRDERVVANTRPKSTVHLLGEHGELAGWMLCRLSSGITGWVHVDTLGKVSDNYAATLGAG